MSNAVRKPLEELVQRWWPSTAVRRDPLASLVVDGRYVPVALNGWKLTPWMQSRLLATRQPTALTFATGLRLGIVIPFRDREAHLAELLPRLALVLGGQGIDYRVIVAEQAPGKPFNRGAMLNAGALHAMQHCDYLCLHDVDALPVEANYLCPSQPLRLVHRLLGSATGAERPRRYFSGAVSLRREQFARAHGFSNGYWGWGKEDDDFLFRLLLTGHVCFADQQGIFEDLANPADQQVRPERAEVTAAVRRNRERRSDLLRGLSDPAEDGIGTPTFSITGVEQADGFERVRVSV